MAEKKQTGLGDELFGTPMDEEGGAASKAEPDLEAIQADSEGQELS